MSGKRLRHTAAAFLALALSPGARAEYGTTGLVTRFGTAGGGLVAPGPYADAEQTPFAGAVVPLAARGPFDIDRFQQVYDSALFPGGPVELTSASFRIAATFAGVRVTVPDLTVRAGTTPVGSATIRDTTFDANLGANAVTLFAGPLALDSPGAAGQGEVNPFDITISFAAPYLYDPAAGNLILEMDFAQNFDAPYTALSDARDAGMGWAWSVRGQPVPGPSGAVLGAFSIVCVVVIGRKTGG